MATTDGSVVLLDGDRLPRSLGIANATTITSALQSLPTGIETRAAFWLAESAKPNSLLLHPLDASVGHAADGTEKIITHDGYLILRRDLPDNADVI